jgi:hypothetical protein
MRNAGDLAAADDLYAEFQAEGLRMAESLALRTTVAAFALPRHELEREYFNRFDGMCREIRGAGPGATT